MHNREKVWGNYYQTLRQLPRPPHVPMEALSALRAIPPAAVAKIAVPV